MSRNALIALCAGGLLWALGCGRNSDPPPRYISSGGPALAPVPVRGQALDSTIKASAQPLPDLEGKEAAGPADAPAAENDNEAEKPKTEDATGASGDNPEPAEAETAAEPASEPPPQPTDNTTARPQRQPDELDGVYTGPNMLRDR